MRGLCPGHPVGMPKLSKAQRERLPSTLERSEDKAARTFVETLESAEQVRGHEGDESYAHRVAYSAVKHSYEKVGDHWEPKADKGPSDGGRDDNAGGVDRNASKKHLYELATRLGVEGRSRMTKSELVEALQKANDRASARARS